jgi:hypothetical protein
MKNKPDRIALQLLLLPTRRKPRDVSQAARLVAKFGLPVSGSGSAAITATLSRDELSARLVALDETSYAVPPELADYIESITVAPRHDYHS